MAKELTLPTPPAAPSTPRVGIGDRIQGIESRIQEIENIGNMGRQSNSDSKSGRQTARHSYDDGEDEAQDEEQSSQPVQQTRQPSTPRQNQPQQRQPTSRDVTTPETMARDAVANGSGALTKRTTSRGDDGANSDGGNSQARNQSTIVIPPDSSLNDNGQSSFERGRAVLREFQELDKEQAQSQSKVNPQTSTEASTPGLFAPSYGQHSQHGVAYWLFTLVAIGVLAFVFVKHFMLSKKGSLTKKDLDDTLNTIANGPSSQPVESKITTIKAPVQKKPILMTPKNDIAKSTAIPKPKTKPATLKSKPQKTEDDKKGTRFEIRV